MIDIKLNIFGGYGYKMQKVSKCRLDVSSKNILVSNHEVFFTKSVPLQSITDIVLLDF